MKTSIITLLLIASSYTTFAQKGSAILGRWLNQDKDGQVEIYKNGDQYFGKIVWLKNPTDSQGKPQTDKKNPATALCSRQILGLEVLKNFVCKTPETYVNGTSYNPKRAMTFNCRIAISDSTLKISAYMGIITLGSEVWTRVKPEQKQ
ncbi:MAG: DUF2147 domain-containing protein [Mucilaginibacter sp.]|uniref:DUF2147 domain-containing protein n=1 Tax=Mucilaginibacter sp. TaxID=1882438 RepID=UPI00326680CB